MEPKGCAQQEAYTDAIVEVKRVPKLFQVSSQPESYLTLAGTDLQLAPFTMDAYEDNVLRALIQAYNKGLWVLIASWNHGFRSFFKSCQTLEGMYFLVFVKYNVKQLFNDGASVPKPWYL